VQLCALRGGVRGLALYVFAVRCEGCGSVGVVCGSRAAYDRAQHWPANPIRTYSRMRARTHARKYKHGPVATRFVLRSYAARHISHCRLHVVRHVSQVSEVAHQLERALAFRRLPHAELLQSVPRHPILSVVHTQWGT
jgi:hypothetical protein